MRWTGDIILLALGAADRDAGQARSRLRGQARKTTCMVVCLLARRRELADLSQGVPACVDQVLVKPLTGTVLRRQWTPGSCSWPPAGPVRVPVKRTPSRPFRRPSSAAPGFCRWWSKLWPCRPPGEACRWP